MVTEKPRKLLNHSEQQGTNLLPTPRFRAERQPLQRLPPPGTGQVSGYSLSKASGRQRSSRDERTATGPFRSWERPHQHWLSASAFAAQLPQRKMGNSPGDASTSKGTCSAWTCSNTELKSRGSYQRFMLSSSRMFFHLTLDTSVLYSTSPYFRWRTVSWKNWKKQSLPSVITGDPVSMQQGADAEMFVYSVLESRHLLADAWN